MFNSNPETIQSIWFDQDELKLDEVIHFCEIAFLVLWVFEVHHQRPAQRHCDGTAGTVLYCLLWCGSYNYNTHNAYLLHLVDGWIKNSTVCLSELANRLDTFFTNICLFIILLLFLLCYSLLQEFHVSEIRQLTV